MKNIQFLFFCLLALIISSCQNDELSPLSDEKTEPLISTDNLTVSPQLAERAALMFRKSGTKNNRLKSASSTVENISTVYDEDGTPAMYIIDYSDNGGFIIVGATKNYHPILAYSDSGSFDIKNSDMPTGVAEWILDGKSIVKKQMKEQNPDSLALFHRAWRIYEEPKNEEMSILKNGNNDDFYTTVSQLMQQWTMQGIRYQDYSPDMDISLEIHNLVLSKTMDYYPTKAFILTEYDDITEVIGPLMTTTWDQGPPYNMFIPNGYPTGCVATAMAQVMNYHRWPRHFHWDAMRNNYNGSGITEDEKSSVANLMLGAGMYVHTDYGANGSSAKTSDVPAALKTYFGYAPAVKHTDYDFSAVAREIGARRPVILNGKRDSFLGIISYNGHAWVCDGYTFLSSRRKTTVVVINGMEMPVRVDYVPIDGWIAEYSMSYLHMNWGWDGKYNAWFHPHNWGFSNNRGEYIDYKHGKGMVINIYPNR